MRLNKKEAKFLADNLTKWAEVTQIEVNDVEVRVYGIYDLSDEMKKFHKEQGWDDYKAGTGSTALYRTNDVKRIYEHSLNKIKSDPEHFANKEALSAVRDKEKD